MAAKRGDSAGSMSLPGFPRSAYLSQVALLIVYGKAKNVPLDLNRMAATAYFHAEPKVWNHPGARSRGPRGSPFLEQSWQSSRTFAGIYHARAALHTTEAMGNEEIKNLGAEEGYARSSSTPSGYS